NGRGMKVLPLVLAGFILGGCAAEGGVLSEVQEAAADLFLPPEQAAQLGARMAQEIEAKQPLHPSAELQARVARLGERVLAQAGEVPQAYDFSFKAIQDPDTVNAFALPGGHIYLTRGLVERTRTGEEFAGVLAHEIGHVAARHGVQKLQRHLRTGSLVNVLYNTILGGEPSLLRENSLQIANVVWSAGHSRRDEREADRLAVEYMLRSGVDPDGIVSLLSTLLTEERQQQVDEVGMMEMWLSTHPLTAERIEAAERDIRRLRSRTEATADLEMDAFPAFRKVVLRQAPPPIEMIEP
ncbi:MAG TPA: M48 family metallopeptidase, partial [Longimicrobiaceae bacterium]|nr:M48 family metallopeptidase [Longimicrobiaceae bacterium]